MEFAEKQTKGTRFVFLHDEIITHEILPWVPVKSLFRFKLVCRKWHKLISKDPDFIKSQSVRCLSFPSAFLCRRPFRYLFLSLETKKLVRLTYDSLGYLHSCNIFNQTAVASSNGLFCGFTSRELGTNLLKFYVANPATKEFVFIPNPDEETSRRNIGFGFNPGSCNPYYVVAFPFINSYNYDSYLLNISFKFYTSPTGEWSISNAKVQLHRDREYWMDWRSQPRSVFIGNTLYWKFGKDVLWFDNKEDRAGIVATPIGMDQSSPYSVIGECKDKLSYSTIIFDDIEVWVLSRNKDFVFQWAKLYCLSARKIYEDNKKIMSLFYPTIDIWNKLPRRALPFEGGDDVLFWGERQGHHADTGIVFSYNCVTGVVQLIHDTFIRGTGLPILSYKSSLASPFLP